MTYSGVPPRRKWTCDEFLRMAAAGLFGPEARVELVGGEIIEKTPQTSQHATGIILACNALQPIFRQGYDIRCRMPLALDTWNLPDPDAGVVTGEIRDYTHAHPTTAVLVVEVSDTTLLFDRTTKAGMYAAAGIWDYWIVNLVDRVLEVHRQPGPMTGQPSGHHYRSITRYTEDQTITPLAAEGSPILVGDLLP